MGTEQLAAVFDHSRQSGSNLVILLTVANFSDHRGEWVADQPTLQKRARLTRRHVQRILCDLVQSGELAITSHHGRGHRSTYRLLVAPPNEHPPAPPKRAPTGAYPAEKAATRTAYPRQEPATRTAFSAPKSASTGAFRNPPSPPCPSFPPDPQYSLNPPYPPKTQNEETFGLPPAPATTRQAASAAPKEHQASLFEPPSSPLPAAREGAGRGARGEGVFPASTTAAIPAVLVPPLPGKGGGSWERGGGEGAVRPLTQPQSATFRTNLLLEEHAIPLPTPAQIGLWAKTLGGIEPLLDLLRRLIQAGLATKREPIAYIHRVVLERAARPEPFSPLPAAGGAMGEGPGVRFHSPSWRAGRPHNPTLAAGVDDIRRQQAARIAGITLPGSGA